MGGSGTVSASTVLINAVAGTITSSTSNLGASSTDTFTLSNSYIASSSILLVTVKSSCTNGLIFVSTTSVGTESATIGVTNVGMAACSSTYTLHFMLVNGS